MRADLPVGSLEDGHGGVDHLFERASARPLNGCLTAAARTWAAYTAAVAGSRTRSAVLGSRMPARAGRPWA